MIEKIIEAMRIANVADVPCTLTAEQCDRLLDALAEKDEEIARLKEVVDNVEDAMLGLAYDILNRMHADLKESLAEYATRPGEPFLTGKPEAPMTKHKPIPVSERMPEQGDRVLLYDSWEAEWIGGELTTFGLVWEVSQWTTDHEDYWHGNDFSRVTHWMPLPEAPDDQA